MKHNSIFAMLLSLACVTGFVACDDDDTPAQELQKPAVEGTLSNYEALDFEWEPVANTIQYGYKLFDPDGKVVDAGVTRGTSVGFTGLLPATTYTLRVWAFAGMDTDYTTSPAAELTATTASLVRLLAPGHLDVTGADGTYTASWDAVPDAESYSYTITSEADAVVASGSVSEPELRIPALEEEGDYTISVKACTSQGGYIDSEASTFTFSYVKPSGDYLWKATGTYHSFSLDRDWEATMAVYANGLYSIEAFYGVEGVNLDFSLASDGSVVMDCGELFTDGGYKYWLVPTGVEEIGDLFCYVWDGYTVFRGNSDGGTLWLGNYDYDWNFGYDTFTWTGSAAGGGSASLTIDDLVGPYASYMVGKDSLGSSEIDADYEWYGAEISKVDENTVAISNLYWEGYPVEGTVDFGKGTITISPQECGYYIFASIEGVDEPVVATIAPDGTITLPHISYWYGSGSAWTSYSDLTITLTKDVTTYAASRKVPAKAPYARVKRKARR